MRSRAFLYGLFGIAVLLHAGWAMAAWKIKPKWTNVPPVPRQENATGFALGDKQLAYRTTGIMLQNLGNTGGRYVTLSDYNYDELGKWLRLADKLDPQSNYIPLLAAYYFGATQNPKQLDTIIDYLTMVGQRPQDEKWRWLGQAVYLARFRQVDYDKALSLSQKLAEMWHPGMPGWVKQMPVFVMMNAGDKQAAYDLMLRIIKEDGEKMDPNELNFMVSYICERILDQASARENALCKAGYK